MNALRPRHLPLVGALAAGAVVLLASPATAHIDVDPGEAEQGGYRVISFRVPNERDNASTVKLEVFLPTDRPLVSVMPQPVPGWEVKVTKSTLDKPADVHGTRITKAVTKVTWTGGTIEPGTFQQFPLSVGQLPEDADQLVFKALQTYDNKEVVRWIEEPKDGGEEPAYPAPVLKLVKASADADGHETGAQAADSAGKSADAEGNARGASSDTEDGGDTTARLLGGAGVAVGVAGVVIGVLAGRRRSTS